MARRRAPRGRRAGRACALGVLATLACLTDVAPARAQLFIASRADPAFAIGPLSIRASVTEGVPLVTIDVLWSLVLPPGRSAADAAQDLYLLWPGEVVGDTGPGTADAALARYVEAQGFDIVGEGRVALLGESLADKAAAPAPDARAGAASYVVFVQTGGAQGLSPPATFIRIPWTPRLADRASLMDLRFKMNGLVKPRKATWLERLVVGGQSTITISWNEMRDRPLFAMYFAHRDRVVPLADAPSELVVNFANSDRLKIDQVFPPTSIRRISETLESTEVVSLFLDKSDGITPQQVAVQFGYFSAVQAWALVLVPAFFFMVGQAMGPLIGRSAVHVGGLLAARLRVGGWHAGPGRRETGQIVPRETLAKLVPGRTTRAEILRLCGDPTEAHEEYATPGRQVFVYRGRRLVPSARRIFAWLSAVRHWQVERQEVKITLDQDLVSDVQASTRHYRRTADEPD
jgi:hypothetical protein